MRTPARKLFLAMIAGATMACTEGTAREAAHTEAGEEPMPAHTDSILPVEEEIRRFRESAGRTAVTLEGGATSRDELIEHVARAVQHHDTATLVGLVIDRAEFIGLYYPHGEYVREPYRLSPELLWMLFTQNGEKGLRRTLQRFGGRLEYAGHRCESPVRQQGPNRLWERCVIRRRAADDAGAAELVLFGSILERDGRFKLVSWANDL